MGNCWGSSSDRDTSHCYSSTNIPTTPGTSNSCSNNIEFSATSSASACRSQFSETVSEIVEEESPDGRILETPNLKVFTFAELKTATKNFKGDTLLGEGGFGRVYKGWVDEKTLTPSKVGSGMIVAIKKLNHERNPAIEPLSWELRLKIAIGAARGLAFLHTSEKVIYRDFKASNILLDGNYNAKISDFGLAKLGPAGGESHVTTRVMGTYGYAAPEYIATAGIVYPTGHLYVKSDVYGFGVVLLELMTGLRALDTKRLSGQQNLVDWLRPTLSLKKKVKTIMDVRIEGQYSSKAAILSAELTLKCLEHDPKNRPSMKEVGEALERIESLNKEKSKDSSKSGSNHSTTPRHGQHSTPHRSPLQSRRRGAST
ncbi:hypothetical protein SCA6_012565 [Theobroma cacao]